PRSRRVSGVPATHPRFARSPSRLGYGQRLEASPQQSAPAPATVRLYVPAAPLARPGPTPAHAGRSDRPRRARLLGQFLPLGTPNMTEEGLVPFMYTAPSTRTTPTSLHGSHSEGFRTTDAVPHPTTPGRYSTSSRIRCGG